MIKEIILAIIQGVTEFLPISSSGHLALFSNFFSEVNLSLFVYLHFASLLAVVIFLRKKIKDLFLKRRKYFLFVLFGIIPAVFIGFLFRDLIERTFSSLLFLGLCFLISSIFLFLTKFQKKEISLNYMNSFLIGLFQILSLFPGISRSGITISSARILGVKKEEAFDFSFLMFIPLVIGASFLEIFDKKDFFFSINFIIPFILCFFISYFSLAILNQLLKENNLWLFGFYCLFLGFLCIILFLLNM
ncbi:MAG: undecaprenyl-diphosphate phosphatase [Candidatus Pacearchaeota archaeon]